MGLSFETLWFSISGILLLCLRRDKSGERGLTYKSANSFVQSIKSRLTVAQVVEGVRGSAVLTFDFIMFVLLAG